jgi:hypothetical protein
MIVSIFSRKSGRLALALKLTDKMKGLLLPHNVKEHRQWKVTLHNQLPLKATVSGVCSPQEAASCRDGGDRPGRRGAGGLPAWVAASREASHREAGRPGAGVLQGRMVVAVPRGEGLQQEFHLRNTMAIRSHEQPRSRSSDAGGHFKIWH